MSEIKCANCRSWYPTEDYKGPKGIRKNCSKCTEKKKRHKKAYLAKRPEYMKEYSRETVTGVTPEEYKRMLIQQDGKCFLCGRSAEETNRELHVDHDHLTGRIRKLLCVGCNLGLGRRLVNPDLQAKAEAYVRADYSNNPFYGPRK
jgi:hypothetical protein